MFSFAPFQISLIFQDLCTNFANFNAIFAEFQERQQILQIFAKFSPNFFRVSQTFSDLDRSDVKMMIFHRNLRKIAEVIKEVVNKILKICPEKNVYSFATVVIHSMSFILW